MDPHTHFMFPFAIGLLLTKLNIIDWKLALLCGFMGMFIDIDHYIEHILHAKNNRFSLKATWNNSRKWHHFSQRSFIHHWNGALILTVILGIVTYFNWRVALVLATGYYSHLVLDFLFNLKKEKSFNWKIGQWYMKEKHLEFVLDVFLFIVIIVLLIYYF